MLKSRFVILVFLLLMSVSGVCSADDRWFVVQNDSELIAHLDTSKIILYGVKNKDLYIDCWIQKSMKSVANSFSLEHTHIRILPLSQKITDVYIYKNDKCILSEDRSSEGWRSPPPSSRQEETIINALHWVSTNRDKVIDTSHN